MRSILFPLALLAATSPATAIAPGDMAPPFTLRLLSGGTQRLATLKGRVVVLTYWATWCAPCRIELRDMDALYRRYARDGLAIVAIDAEDRPPPARVAAFAAAMTIPIATAMEQGGTAYPTPSTALPHTIVIDRAGRVRLVRTGAFGPGAFAAAIAPLLTETPPRAQRR